MEILLELEQAPADTYVSAYDVASVHAALGNADQAFAWLDKARAERSTFLVFIGWDPRFSAIRSDSRYSRLVHSLGLS